MPPRERLIVALDLPEPEAARRLVERLGEAVVVYKVGLELYATRGARELTDWLVGRGKRVFLDLKLCDIPETVRRAVAALRDSGASFLSVHAQPGCVEAALAAKGELSILAVTVLTSVSDADLAREGWPRGVEALVAARARAALAAGADGLVASAREAAMLRRSHGRRFVLVTPGIRPRGAAAGDQKRTADAGEAIAAGADYVVVGRPVRDAPDPRAAAEALQAEIARAAAR